MEQIWKHLENVKVYFPEEKLIKKINLLQEIKDNHLLLYGYQKLGSELCNLEQAKISDQLDSYKNNNILVVGYSYIDEKTFLANLPKYINHYQIIDESGELIKAIGSKSFNKSSNRNTYVFNKKLDLIFEDKAIHNNTRDWNKILSEILFLKKVSI